MRAPLPAVVAFVAAVALVAPTSAQDSEPGCLQTNPCDVHVDVDPLGLDLGQDLFTAGDWVRLSVYNDDSVPHTVSLSGHDVTLVVPPYDVVESSPFEMARPGAYRLSDSPSGDNATVTVEPAASFDGDDGGEDGDRGERNGVPGPVGALVLLALVMAAVASRRFR